VQRDDGALARLLDAWPRDLPLTVEFQHPSWRDDVVYSLLVGAGACLCATDLDASDQPDLHVTSEFLYLRLRRTDYRREDLQAWAARLEPFLSDGLDTYVFLRHDQTGASALNAEVLAEMLDQRTQPSLGAR
jgi:uncharacterized protein YecE (DUF72 family)